MVPRRLDAGEGDEHAVDGVDDVRFAVDDVCEEERSDDDGLDEDDEVLGVVPQWRPELQTEFQAGR